MRAEGSGLRDRVREPQARIGARVDFVGKKSYRLEPIHLNISEPSLSCSQPRRRSRGKRGK
jgi:hypothetical protein